ncbi:MAG: PAS domain S-box protein [bacterium]|nr:PAS domain S-box protein [bacterium]
MKYEILKEFINFAERSICGFYIFDSNLQFIYVNPAFCKIVGYEKEEIIGKKKALDWVFEDDKEEVKRRIEKRFLGDVDIETYIVRFIHKNGNIKYCYASGQLKEINEEKVIVGVVIDLTEKIEYQKKLENQNKILKETLDGTINAFAKIIEIKDPSSPRHQYRVSKICEIIGRKIGLNEKEIEEVVKGSLVHDIGKIGVPSEILALPRKLTMLEMEIVKIHPIVGYEILKDIPHFKNIALMVLQHHERLDGSGYPYGIKEEKIIKEARILGIADVIEAMLSHRPYRAKLEPGDVIRELSNNKGKKYDLEIAELAIKLIMNKELEIS